MSRLKVLVAIPTYNCERQISRVIEGLDDSILKRVDKVIVIDNGSKDNTVKAAIVAAKKLGSNKIEIWQNKDNYNLGGTHKVAFLTGEKLGMDYVAILHGDDQAKTQELNNLIDSATENPEAGAILGTRFMKGSKLVGYDWKRIWGNRAINIFYSIIALRPSKDLGSGLNLFKLKDLADHRYLGFSDTITFNIDLLLDFFRKKTNIIFAPITWTEEDQVSNARNFTVGKTAIIKILKWRIGNPEYKDMPADHYVSKRV
jgi:dolichol-phosphate mannosyltransferase